MPRSAKAAKENLHLVPHHGSKFSEVPDQAETLDDVGKIPPSNAMVTGSDWTTETILNQINKGNILLNPDFQRRDAWDSSRKSRFIESLFLGLPIPQIVLAEAPNRRGAFIVIDGKQRLLAIRQFAASEDDAQFQQLILSKLAVRTDLNGYSLQQLQDDPSRFQDLSQFENQTIRTVVIKNWSNEQFLYQVFLRLNTGSVPLSPQELRQALHPGKFVSYADAYSGSSPALRQILNIEKPDFRMRDTELFIRYIAFQLFLESYAGDLKAFLDQACKHLNETWPSSEAQVKTSAERFEKAYEVTELIFGTANAFRKWTGSEYESRFNRAIFDVMVYYFSDSRIGQRAVAKRQEIEKTFKRLCSDDQLFLSSIERTTKSLEATCSRLWIWGTHLNKLLGLKIKVPVLKGKRIEFQ